MAGDITVQRISLVTLGVDDLARSRAFYAALGWQEHPASQDSVVFYQMAGSVFGLFGRSDMAKDQGRPGADLGIGAAVMAQNFASREAVDAAYEAAIAAGARVLKRPEPVFWGGYSGYWADPDGHPWEYAWNPGLLPAADGTVALPEA